MIPALYIFIAMVVIGLILFIHDRITNKPDDAPQEPQQEASHDDCNDECCGINEVCPSEMMLKHIDDPVAYYEDEELDTFRGRDATNYSDDELEQWRATCLGTLGQEARYSHARSDKTGANLTLQHKITLKNCILHIYSMRKSLAS